MSPRQNQLIIKITAYPWLKCSMAFDLQEVEHWAQTNDRLLLFDPVKSELPLLDVFNAALMTDIYKSKHSGWITIGVVRDPVTRLLSLYIHFVRTIDRQWGEMYSSIDQAQCQEKKAEKQETQITTGEIQRASNIPREDLGIAKRCTEARDKAKLGVDSDQYTEKTRMPPKIPTIAEILDRLAENRSSLPPAFRPISTMCGMSKSPFDVLIPFETLQVRVHRAVSILFIGFEVNVYFSDASSLMVII